MNCVRQISLRPMNFLCVMLFTSLIPAYHATAQDDVTLEYTREFLGNMVGTDMVQDDDGNTYVVGAFSKKATFELDNDDGFLAYDGYVSAYACKLDVNGNLLWAVSMHDTVGDRKYGFGVNPHAVALDGDNNVVITGYFDVAADFDPGEGTAILTPPGYYADDVYIQKLDTNGNFLWVKSLQGIAFKYDGYIAADALGNVFLTGYYGAPIDLDPGEDEFILTPHELEQVFLLKLDTDGNFAWAKSFDGFHNYNEQGSGAIATDGAGNVYVTARTGDIPDIDLNRTPTYPDSFIRKLDTDGNEIWARYFRGKPGITLPPGTSSISSIALDPSGNIYTAGNFAGNVDFDPGNGESLGSTGGNKIFVNKLNADGSFAWVRFVSLNDFNVQSGGFLKIRGFDIAVDFAGNAYINGTYDSHFGLFEGLPFVTGRADFIRKWNSNGDVAWTKEGYQFPFYSGNAILVDGSANVFTMGSASVSFSSDFDFSAIPHVFISKFSSGRVGVLSRNLTLEETSEGGRLELTAPPGAVSYQWLKNGLPLNDGGTIFGAATQTLIIDPLSLDDTGAYSCLYDDGTPRAMLETEGTTVTVRDSSSGGGGGCIIAHLTHGTAFEHELASIRAFRDSALLNNPFGRAISNVYYQLSPSAVRWTSTKREETSSVFGFLAAMVACLLVFRAFNLKGSNPIPGQKK